MWSSDSGIRATSAPHLGLAMMRRNIQRWQRNIGGDVGRCGVSPNNCWLWLLCIEFCKAILQVGLKVIYTQLLDVKPGGTVGCLVPCFSTSVAREWKWLHFKTSVNIHWSRVSGGWSVLVICPLLRSLKSNGVEGGWMGQSQSNTQSLVGRPETFVGGSVLVNGPGCSVPVHWNHVGRMSRRHGCYSILNLSVKSLTEFHHYALWIGVTSFRDKVLEFIEVFIHGATLWK